MLPKKIMTITNRHWISPYWKPNAALTAISGILVINAPNIESNDSKEHINRFLDLNRQPHDSFSMGSFQLSLLQTRQSPKRSNTQGVNTDNWLTKSTSAQYTLQCPQRSSSSAIDCGSLIEMKKNPASCLVLYKDKITNVLFSPRKKKTKKTV